MTQEVEDRSKFRLSPEFWVTIFTILVGLGVPAVLWGGRMDSRVERVEENQRAVRIEYREDLREINQKLDKLMDRIK
jgi:hypothetical protein